eukprot:GHVT01028900.1.p1 GENE.GHVT01028900.1~~GHVT01028900.1.p1  ORF type:complete len:130 (+),score=6.41 GHVT01028900.1:236-625(+)
MQCQAAFSCYTASFFSFLKSANALDCIVCLMFIENYSSQFRIISEFCFLTHFGGPLLVLSRNPGGQFGRAGRLSSFSHLPPTKVKPGEHSGDPVASSSRLHPPEGRLSSKPTSLQTGYGSRVSDDTHSP